MKHLCGFLLTAIFLSGNAPAYAWQQLHSTSGLMQSCAVTGSVTLYDKERDTWWYSNREDAQDVSLPSSTFKIIHSLIALDSGVVVDEKQVIPWDGEEKRIPWSGELVPAWNKDTDMQTAFQNSTIWFYEALAQQIPLAAYHRHLEAADYGNGNLTGDNGVNFWVYGNFAVSPIGQIRFLRRLEGGYLPFPEHSMEIVKRIMIVEQAPEYTIRAKTGWTLKDGRNIGWWVGYASTRDNTYFFATRLYSAIGTDSSAMLGCRKSLTKAALREIGAPIQD